MYEGQLPPSNSTRRVRVIILKAEPGTVQAEAFRINTISGTRSKVQRAVLSSLI